MTKNKLDKILTYRSKLEKADYIKLWTN